MRYGNVTNNQVSNQVCNQVSNQVGWQRTSEVISCPSGKSSSVELEKGI